MKRGRGNFPSPEHLNNPKIRAECAENSDVVVLKGSEIRKKGPIRLRGGHIKTNNLCELAGYARYFTFVVSI